MSDSLVAAVRAQKLANESAPNQAFMLVSVNRSGTNQILCTAQILNEQTGQEETVDLNNPPEENEWPFNFAQIRVFEGIETEDPALTAECELVTYDPGTQIIELTFGGIIGSGQTLVIPPGVLRTQNGLQNAPLAIKIP